MTKDLFFWMASRALLPACTSSRPEDEEREKGEREGRERRERGREREKGERRERKKGERGERREREKGEREEGGTRKGREKMIRWRYIMPKQVLAQLQGMFPLSIFLQPH